MLGLFLCSLLTLTPSFGSCTNARADNKRAIIGAYDSPRRDFYVRTKVYDPEDGKTDYFGAVIISENYALSSAHIIRRGQMFLWKSVSGVTFHRFLKISGINITVLHGFWSFLICNFVIKISDLFRFCPPYVMHRQLQCTCHYIVNNYVKIWPVRRGGGL